MRINGVTPSLKSARANKKATCKRVIPYTGDIWCFWIVQDCQEIVNATSRHNTKPQWRPSKWLTTTTRLPYIWNIGSLKYLWYTQYILSVNQCRNKALLTLDIMIRENSPCVECMDNCLCFLLKHRSIITTDYWILLLNPSFVIWQGQPCSYAFHERMSAKNKGPI